jgi:diguanylate cyclase (GGDEF)-like protein/PAS domain S-box-containing protein
MTESRILIVDDEPNLLHSCKALLQSAGFAVSTATSGAQALAMLSETPAAWDLMLLDLNMPDQDGLSVMYELNKRNVDISVVVLSGETAFHYVSKAFQNGAFDYISKPYEVEALVNTIQNALKKRELEKGFVALRRQLERSERLHRFMIESSPDIIFIVDKGGIFRFANDRAEDLLNYKKDELIGQHYSVIVDPEYLSKAAICFNERRTSLRATKDEEVWLLCKAGTVPGSERRRIAIELNSMGVYENETVNEKGERFQRDYSGTYVVARDVTERLASQKLIHYQAYHDLLTGLPNRALFMDRLSNAISGARRQKSKLTVMFLDLDRFKIVNDTLGHDVGDTLLKRIAERLKKCLRESDTLARLGGDEFIVLLPQVESIATAKAVADKIVRSIKMPMTIANHELCVTASVGISMYPDDGPSADALIKNADIAMYHTKDLGKDGFNIFTQALSEQQKQQLSIETEIRRGIREKQFEVYYQPQVDAIDGRISGVEALLRWNHPERGLLTPAFFLPVAEESRLIIELGDWVVDAALADSKQWRDAGLDVGKLAVNFSFRQIEQPDFVDKLIAALKRHDYPGELIEIEITESSLMSDAEKTIDKLRQLHSYGVNIAIDDFGTGYSSLSLLQKLPINRLKIDRSFIQDLQADSDRSIIEAIAHMAKGLKLDMVAEGVEQDYQLRYLRKLQCQVIQGFIYSHCLTADEMQKLLEVRAVLTARSGRILHSV